MRRLIDLIAGSAPAGSQEAPPTNRVATAMALMENRAVTVNSPAFQQWFSGSKVVDKAGNPLAVYHGTARPDRVGAQFLKARATAGPMAFFTNDPAVASNYAKDKVDTSLDDDIRYQDWFKVLVPGKRQEVAIDKVWPYLDGAQQKRILQLAPRVHHEEDENYDSHVALDGPERTEGNGGYEVRLKQFRGNALAALFDEWVEGGLLYNTEEDFLDVLRLAGLTLPVRYDSPHAKYPFVYSVYLAIRNPLVSTAIPLKVLDALREAADKQTTPNHVGLRGQWHKNTTDPKAWFRELLNDIERTGGRLSWTVVPDWVTTILTGFGYDGIMDVGGKNGGDPHVVWIPFDEHQVKSAISNTNFDPSKNGIHETK